MAPVLLNIDLGELPDEPEELYAAAQLANVACGGHAGDRASMERAVARCKRHGTLLGAHPSYPDRANFGRVKLAMAPEALLASVAEQCDALAEVAAGAGVEIGYVKPHGALYHAADRDADLARAVVAGAVESLGYDVRVIGPAGGELARAADAAGVRFLREGFADRGTLPDGTLVPRGQPGALITDAATARAQCEAILRAGRADTVCVHGDTPGSERIARAVRAAVDAAVAG